MNIHFHFLNFICCSANVGFCVSQGQSKVHSPGFSILTCCILKIECNAFKHDVKTSRTGVRFTNDLWVKHSPKMCHFVHFVTIYGGKFDPQIVGEMHPRPTLPKPYNDSPVVMLSKPSTVMYRKASPKPGYRLVSKNNSSISGVISIS